MRIVFSFALVAILLACVSGCATTPKAATIKPDDPEGFLLGRWQSVKFEGGDIGNDVTQAELVLKPDSTFVAIATMYDGSTGETEGPFLVTGDTLTFVVEGEETKTNYSVENGVLIIHNPADNSRAFFEKVK